MRSCTVQFSRPPINRLKDPSEFELVAEEVAKLARELVATNEQGKQFSAFYERVNPMLLNEFIKEHREKQDQQAIIEKQASKI